MADQQIGLEVLASAPVTTRIHSERLITQNSICPAVGRYAIRHRTSISVAKLACELHGMGGHNR